MPSLKTAHPKHRLDKASGRAIVTLNGRDQYLGPHGSSESREKYDALIAQRLAGRRRILAETPHEATVEQLLAAYWVHAESYYRDDEGPCNRECREADCHPKVSRLQDPSRTPAAQPGWTCKDASAKAKASD